MADTAATPLRPRAAAWLALVAVVLLLVPVLLYLTRGAVYPSVKPQSPVLQPLTKRLVLVVIDGLRYDFATDPERAPNLARYMREESSAEVWAGRITMTSAAVLSLGTGTRGDFSQIVLNVHARRTTANDLFTNARAAGLRVGLIGDPVWRQAYGEFDQERLSPGDLALDIDDSAELLADAGRWVSSGQLPNLSVIHFFASDHQGHSFGVFSPTFRQFLLRLDAGLARFLASLPKDTTVAVLSDHGALSNGNHGVDSDLERRTPFFAYGPGIKPGQKLKLDQVDLASTFAALLGVASPAHGVGSPALGLLDLPVGDAGKLACGEVSRLALLSRAAGEPSLEAEHPELFATCKADAAEPERVSAARELSRVWDELLALRAANRGVSGLFEALAVLLVFGLLAPRLLGLSQRGATYRAGFALTGSAALCLALTTQVDRTLPPWNDSRAIVTWLSTLLFAAVALSPRTAERLYRSWPFFALALVPGFFIASFPTNTQVQAGVVLAVCLVGVVRASRAVFERDVSVGISVAAAAIGVGVALRLGAVREDPIGSWLSPRELAVGAALAVLWVLVAISLERATRAARELGLELAVGIPLVIAAFSSRSHLPATLGLGLLVALPLAGLASAARGRTLLARLCFLAGYGLVSRAVELPAVAALGLAAEGIGFLAGRSMRRTTGGPPLAWSIVLSTCAVFAMAFATRVGLQRGLDFGTLDFGAGTFDSIAVPPSRIMLALIAKYVIALSLVAGAFLRWLPFAVVRSSLQLLSAASVLRLATMAAILYAPPVSFWSRFRMLGELGSVVVMCLLALVAVLALGGRREALLGSAPSAEG